MMDDRSLFHVHQHYCRAAVFLSVPEVQLQFQPSAAPGRAVPEVRQPVGD